VIEHLSFGILGNKLGNPWVKLTRNRLRIGMAAIILKNRASRCKSMNEHVEVCFDTFASFPLTLVGWSLRPAQIKEELESLMEILEQKKPKKILEIGTGSGGTLYLFTRVADPNALLISIDLPGGTFGGGYPQWKDRYYKSLAVNHQTIHLIRGDSHSLTTLQTVDHLLNKSLVDFLFIDGDHRYEGVKTDFEIYSRLVGKDSLIVLHDIAPGPEEKVGGVPIFWNHVKDRFRYVEFVKDWKQGGWGIGVLYT